jgi:hypothetical protein
MLILIYHTDAWHSYNSFNLIGTAFDKGRAIELIDMYCAKHGQPELSSECVEQLYSMGQTQSYDGEGEFVIQEIEENTLLC